MSAIVNERGAMIAEKYLFPFHGGLRNFRTRHLKSPIKVIVGAFENQQISELNSEYESLYLLLDNDGSHDMILPKKDRFQFYSSIIPKFEYYLKERDKRGGDRKSPNFLTNQSKKRFQSINLQEVERIINLLVPESLVYTVIQRDFAEYRSTLKSGGRLPQMQPVLRPTKIANTMGIFFDANRYRKNIKNLSTDKLVEDLDSLVNCAKLVQTAIRRRRHTINLDNKFLSLRERGKHNVMRKIAEIHEILMKFSSEDEFRKALYNILLIMQKGQWNYKYPEFSADKNYAFTAQQRAVLNLLDKLIDKTIELDYTIPQSLITDVIDAMNALSKNAGYSDRRQFASISKKAGDYLLYCKNK